MPGKNTDVVLRVHWDSCVFISWFNGGEGRTSEQMEALEQWVGLVDEGRVMIVTSTITYAEVLECRMTEANYRRFERFILGPTVELVAVDWGVVKRAREMREAILAAKRPGLYSQLSIPDALQLATASLSKVNQFHTYDGAGRKNGLLKLDGRLPGTPHICAPTDPGFGTVRRIDRGGYAQGELGISEPGQLGA